MVVWIYMWFFHHNTETVYCHIEKNFTEGDFPRYECINMKIVSKDVNKINYAVLLAIPNATVECSGKVSTYQQFFEGICSEGANYYDEFDLTGFCDDCTGNVCAHHAVTFYSNDSLSNDDFFMEYRQKDVDIENMPKLFAGCT